MLNQLWQGRNINNNGAQALDPPVPVNNQDIIILGGWYAQGYERISNTVEKVSQWEVITGKNCQG